MPIARMTSMSVKALAVRRAWISRMGRIGDIRSLGAGQPDYLPETVDHGRVFAADHDLDLHQPFARAFTRLRTANDQLACPVFERRRERHGAPGLGSSRSRLQFGNNGNPKIRGVQ